MMMVKQAMGAALAHILQSLPPQIPPPQKARPTPPPRTHQHVHSRPLLCRLYRPPHVTITNHADARARVTDLADEVGVARTIQDEHRDVTGWGVCVLGVCVLGVCVWLVCLIEWSRVKRKAPRSASTPPTTAPPPIPAPHGLPQAVCDGLQVVRHRVLQ